MCILVIYNSLLSFFPSGLLPISVHYFHTALSTAKQHNAWSVLNWSGSFGDAQWAEPWSLSLPVIILLSTTKFRALTCFCLYMLSDYLTISLFPVFIFNYCYLQYLVLFQGRVCVFPILPWSHYKCDSVLTLGPIWFPKCKIKHEQLRGACLLVMCYPQIIGWMSYFYDLWYSPPLTLGGIILINDMNIKWVATVHYMFHLKFFIMI